MQHCILSRENLASDCKQINDLVSAMSHVEGDSDQSTIQVHCAGFCKVIFCEEKNCYCKKMLKMYTKMLKKIQKYVKIKKQSELFLTNSNTSHVIF